MTNAEREAREAQIHAQMLHQAKAAMTGCANMLEASGFDGIEFARALMGADFLDAATRAELGHIVDRCDTEGHVAKPDTMMERGMVDDISRSLCRL